MKIDDEVAWKWGKGLAQGTVVKICNEKTEIEIKGKRVVRNGTLDNPAIIIKHTFGSFVLKLSSEVQTLSK